MNARPLLPPILRSTVLIAALLACSTSSAAVLTQPPEPTATPGSSGPVDATTGPLRVTVAPGIDDASLMPGWIEERNPSVGQALALPGHTQWLEVKIGGATYDYRVTVTPMRDGTALGPARAPLPCVCNSKELLALLGEQIDGAIAELESTPAEPEPEPEPEPELEPEPEPEPEPELARTGVSPLSRLGIGGIITGGLGAGVVVVGVVLVVRGAQPVSDIPLTYVDRDYRPLGFAMLSVGGSALIAGVTMLALDLTRCERRPDAPKCSSNAGEAPRRRARVAPILAPGTAGAAIHGRF